MIIFQPLLVSCMRMALHVMSLVSVVNVKRPVKLENEIIGEEKHFLIFFSKVLFTLSVQTNSLLTLLS